MSDHKHPPLAQPMELSGGLYDPSFEHDSCGVGLIASLDGTPRRDVVEAGIAALKAVWHRGAVDADGKTGDGAGIHVEIPQDFFREHVEATGQGTKGRRLAVGMVFLAQDRSRRAGPLPQHRGDGDSPLRPRHPGLAPGADRFVGDRREGECQPAGDRAGHGRQRARRR